MEQAIEDRVRYLRVIGRLYADGRLRLKPSYLADAAPWADREGEGEGVLVAELYDAADALLTSCPLRLQATCAYDQGRQVRAVRGWVPFHPGTRTVRFVYRGRVIHQIRRSEASPRVTLTWQPREREEGRRLVTWNVDHPERERVQFFLRYSHNGGRNWSRLGFRTEETRREIDLDELPGGERCRLAVVATDGINTTMVESEPFAVALKPCRAMIVAPVDGSTFGPGAPVQLIGQGYWLEEGRTERQALTLVSSREGELGLGPAVEIASLTPGEHRITLLAGMEPRQGSESVTIRCLGEEPAAESA